MEEETISTFNDSIFIRRGAINNNVDDIVVEHYIENYLGHEKLTYHGKRIKKAHTKQKKLNLERNLIMNNKKILNNKNELEIGDSSNIIYKNKQLLLNDIKQKENEINKYQLENKQLRNEINEKNRIIEELKNENNLINNELKHLKITLEKLKGKEKEMDNKIMELEKNTDKIKKYKSKYKDEDFTSLKEIPNIKGAYGTIYSAFSIKDQKEICLKKIDVNYMRLQYKKNEYYEESYLKDLNNEIEILKLLSSNKNSVEYLGSYDIIEEKVIVMEKCDENLEQFLKSGNKSLTIDEIKKIFIDLNKLFEIMYKNNIIHRDLKLKNFLIKYINKEKTEFIVKLSDYGIGKFLNESNSIFSGLKGSLETVAPELILEKTKKYDTIVDIFSLGVILYQMSHNLKHPFEGPLYINYYQHFNEDDYIIEFDTTIQNHKFKDLITKMLKINPVNRLKWEDYFEHPFFK